MKVPNSAPPTTAPITAPTAERGEWESDPAFASGPGPGGVADIEGRRPLVRDEDVVVPADLRDVLHRVIALGEGRDRGHRPLTSLSILIGHAQSVLHRCESEVGQDQDDKRQE